jgi:mannan endo-1,4-beta-mannosidase
MSFQQMNLPLIAGEDGNVHAGQAVAWQTVQSEAQERGIGWIAWSWSGDGVGLDQVGNFNTSQMPQWGQQVFNSQYGIRNTSRPATVFASCRRAAAATTSDGPSDSRRSSVRSRTGSRPCGHVPIADPRSAHGGV